MAKDGNRQKFADLDGKGGEGGPEPEEGNAGKEGEGGDDGDGGNEPELKYTDADMDEIVKKKLARERAKLERQIRESIEKEAEDQRTEAEKLANMTELERAKYEARQLKAEKAALEAERDFNRQMAIARSELSEAGINMSDELLTMFVSDKAEKTSAALAKLKELWPKEVNAAVQKALKRELPPGEKAPGQKSYGASFAEQYNKRVNGEK